MAELIGVLLDELDVVLAAHEAGEVGALGLGDDEFVDLLEGARGS